jgi:hypothetical protein
MIEFFLRRPMSEAKPYRFAASTGTISTRVKGTTFAVAFDETTQTSTVTVEDGEVEITPKNPALQVFTLRQGQQVQVSWNSVGAVAPYAAAGGPGRRGRAPAAGSRAAGFGPREGNTTFQGATTLRYFPMQDAFPDRCRDACAAEAACVAYTYVNPGAFRAGDPPMCYLSSAIGQRVSSPCCVSGVKSAGGLGPDVDGSTLRDAKILTYYTSPSAAACRADCERDSERCAGFSWVRPGAFHPGDAPMCYLASSYAEQVASSCCVSGVKEGPSRAGVPAPAPPPPAPARAAQSAVDLRGVWTGPVTCTSGNYPGVYAQTITIGSLGADGTFSGTAGDASPFTMRAAGDQVRITRPTWGQTWTGRLTRTATGLSIDGTTSDGCTFSLARGGSGDSTGAIASPPSPPPPPPPPPAPAAQSAVDLRGVWKGPTTCTSGNYPGVYPLTITISSVGGDGTFSGTAEDGSPFTMRATGDQVSITRPTWGQTWTGRLSRTATGLSIDGTTSNGCTFVLTKP